jgi:hypothetical protein
MIPQITSGNSVTGCVKYNSQKSKKNSSEDEMMNKSNLIYFQNFDADKTLSEIDESYINNYFTNWNTQNTGVKKNVFHCSLNFPVSDNDKINNEILSDIASDFMKRMGYESVPFVVYRHFDKEHQHIHIVSSRIDGQGKRINDYKEQLNAIKIARQIEKDYGLTIVDAKQLKSIKKAYNEVEDNPSARKSYIRNAIFDALAIDKVTTMDDLVTKLSEQNIKMKITEKDGLKKVSFFENSNSPNTKPIYGSKIAKKLLVEINKKIARNVFEAEKDSHKHSINLFLRDLQAKDNLGITELNKLLSKHNLSLDVEKKYLESKEGNTFSFTENKSNFIKSMIKNSNIKPFIIQNNISKMDGYMINFDNENSIKMDNLKSKNNLEELLFPNRNIDFKIEAGKKYYINVENLDDYSKREIIRNIQSGGGEPIVISEKTPLFTHSKITIDMIDKKIGLDNFNSLIKTYNIENDYNNLTADQLNYLASFENIDTLERNIKDTFDKKSTNYLQKLDEKINKVIGLKINQDNYSFQFRFKSINGEKTITDSDYDVQRRNYLNNLLIKKCPSLVDGESKEKQTVAFISSNQNKIKNALSKITADFDNFKSINDIVEQFNRRGLTTKINYEKRNGVYSIQKITINDIHSNTKDSEIILKPNSNIFGTKFSLPYNMFFSNANEVLNNTSEENLKKTINQLNVDGCLNFKILDNKDDINRTNYIEKLSYSDIMNNAENINMILNKNISSSLKAGLVSKIIEMSNNENNLNKINKKYNAYSSNPLSTSMLTPQGDSGKSSDELEKNFLIS